MSLRTTLVKFGAAAIKILPRRPSLAALAAAYLDAYNGDNNMDFDTNGEATLLDNLGPRVQTIFDVGANIGNWSLRITKTSPSAKIHAFEPCKSTFEELNKRTESFRSQIIANNFGLGACSSNQTLISYPSASELGSLYKLEGIRIDELGEPLTEIIRFQALDSYCSENQIESIDLLKVDVEGHEISVLRGAQQMLLKGAIRYVQFEYHATWIYSNSHLLDVFHLLKKSPYKVYKLLGRGRLLHIPRYSQALDTHQYANYLLIAEGNAVPGETIEYVARV